jgi:hypothetical protein
MSKILTAIFDKFGNSEPIFRVNVDDHGDAVRFTPKTKYTPSSDGVTDPVEIHMIRAYQESFDRDARRFEKDDIRPRVWSEMADFITLFYLNNSPLKNPKQSKLYKFLKILEGRYNHESYADGVVSLYRYIKQNANTVSRRYNPDNVHAKNVLLILEKMKEAYERQTP